MSLLEVANRLFLDAPEKTNAPADHVEQEAYENGDSDNRQDIFDNTAKRTNSKLTGETC